MVDGLVGCTREPYASSGRWSAGVRGDGGGAVVAELEVGAGD